MSIQPQLLTHGIRSVYLNMESHLDNPQVRQAMSAYLFEYQIELIWPTGKPHSDLIIGALHARDFRIFSWLMISAFPGFNPFDSIPFDTCSKFSFDRILDIITERAARDRRCDVWKWIIKTGRVPSSEAMYTVDYRNDVEMISLIPWGEEENLEDAAFMGHINCIRYAISEGHALPDGICTSAACGGQLRTLMFLREIGCPWNHELYTSCYDRINYIAQYPGDIEASDIEECMTYALESGCPEAAPVPEG